MTDPLRENIRIDKGVKRPRYKHKPVSPKADLGTWKIPEGLDPDEILAEYLASPSTSLIAARYGVSRKAMVAWLRETRPELWKRVQILRALVRKEDSDEGLETANDALSLARAREMLKSAQFDLERLDSQTWGQKQEVNVQVDHRYQVEAGLFESALELVKSMRGVALQPPIEQVQQLDNPVHNTVDNSKDIK